MEENKVSYKEIDKLYNEYAQKIEEELLKRHLDVEVLQFYTGAKTSLSILKSMHDEDFNKFIRATDPLNAINNNAINN